MLSKIRTTYAAPEELPVAEYAKVIGDDEGGQGQHGAEQRRIRLRWRHYVGWRWRQCRRGLIA